MHAIIRATGPEPVSGPFQDNDGINHPANVLTLWGVQELAAIGVHPIIEPAIPEGKVSTGSTLTWDGQSVTRVHTLADAPPPTSSDVDAERSRRIDFGLTWNGVLYQSRQEDRENVAGAAIMALAAISAGAQPGDLRWHGGASDFVWIAADNSLNPFDAHEFFAFAQAMAHHKSAHIFTARAIKDMDPIPADYADDSYWP